MPHIPQPPSLESKSFRIGDKDPKAVACSIRMPTRQMTSVIVQMMEVRSEIRKTPFSGQLTLKK
jgi:hypothetical protein